MHPRAPVQAFCEHLAERRPSWLSDEQLDRSITTFRDFEAGHHQALSQVHDLLRTADLSSPASVLMAVATVANLTQQSRARPYEGNVSDIPVNIQSSTVAAADDTDDSEGVLVIDLHEDGSDPSQYSENFSDTVEYV